MVDDLAPKGYEIIKALHNSPEQKAACPAPHYFVGFIQQYVTPQLFKDAPNLKLIQMLSAGYDRADLEAARKSGVPLCANGGANSVAVSEHAMLLMLSRLAPADHPAQQRHGRPLARQLAADRPRGAQQGAGHHRPRHDRQEGRQAGAQAFGMIVHYYDIDRLKEEEEDALGVRFRLLPEILTPLRHRLACTCR